MNMGQFGVVAVLAALGGCRSSTSVDCASGAALALQAQSDTGWRARVAAETQQLPADTLLTTGFLFNRTPNAADSSFVVEHGGNIYYVYQGMPAYNVKISDGNLNA